MRETMLARLLASKVAVVARGLTYPKMAALADALLKGGLDVIEIAFDPSQKDRWKDTADAIAHLSERFGSRIALGAGTVLCAEQVRLAHEAGAGFVSSPNANPEIIALTRSLTLLSLPGALTPGEIVTAHTQGADIVKVFPAGSVGPDYLKAVRAPLPHIPLSAVGGVSLDNAADFLRAGAMFVGVGGNLVNKEWVAAGEFDRITALAHQYVKAVKTA